jgi:esterase/lipase superfamily enzyme
MSALDLVKSLAASSRAPGSDRLYVLDDLDFDDTAQQTYALNLLWALDLDDRLKSDRDIAVVGAGLTGVTLAAGLARLGFKVDLFEEQSTILPRQRHPERVIHPMVTNWPEKTPFRALPFLNWNGDGMNHRDALLNECDDLLSDVDVRLHEAVVGVEERPASVALATTREAGPNHYAAAIFAADAQGYWAADDLELQRHRGKQNLVVIGVSQSAAHDALRFIYDGYAAGKLALDLTSLLAASDIAHDIEKAEWGSVMSRALLGELYLQVVGRLPAHVRIDLEGAMLPHTKVTMVSDDRRDVFTGPAAPVQKILLALALHHGRLQLVSGRVKQDDGGIVVGAIQLPLKDTVLAIRHNKPFADLFPQKPRLNDNDAKLFRTKLWPNEFHARLRRRGRPGRPRTSAYDASSTQGEPEPQTELDTATRLLAKGKPAPITVHFATDRECKDGFFGPDYAAELSYGRAVVTIPPSRHEIGRLESPFRLGPFAGEYSPRKHVTLRRITILSHSDFRQSLAHHMSRRSAIMLFIHGFNVTFEDALRRTAQLKFDLRFQGAACLYSWTSRGTADPIAYNRDRERSALTSRHMVEFIETTIKPCDPSRVFVIAHSMGNVALLNALDQLAAHTPVFTEIVLVAPDVNKRLFKQLASAFTRNGKRTTLYGSKWDFALMASRVYSGNEERAGDASPPVIVPGIDSIDVSRMTITHDPINHFCFDDDRVLGDIHEILNGNKNTAERLRIERATCPDGDYWRMRKR